jgi:phosphopantothenoylcysteine decarboxylase/phosphopantothenate--cysteine ligase
MKKVININFQGQVIAIEETAYEILKQYIESLKKYFSQEDGGDEIVNDIESRIAELFGNRLKLGINCITDDDVESIINSIGRPEDFDTEYKVDSESESKKIDEEVSEESELKSEEEPRTLNRNSKDQIIGGVCSGVAHYFKIDPTWIRLLFVIFFGILFWVYIILWIVLKAKPLESNVTKRLYRNPNDKYIAGICGGIAAYFKIESWIPRLIFILPLFINIFGIISFFPLSHLFKDVDFNWNINGSVLLLYLVLWAIVPEAKTVKQKLEMMGEDDYIKNIRNRVNDNVASTKSKNAADNTGSENSFKNNNTQMPPEPPKSERKYSDSASSERSGCMNVFMVLLKIVFFTFAGIFALTLGKMANGIADNMLITTYLSMKAPVFAAPAMDLDMFKHVSTQRNIQRLIDDGVHIIEPGIGELASHLEGKGRMEEPENIVAILDKFFSSDSVTSKADDLNKKKILITAGPTYERIDPVRFIGNFSSGKMGYAIAEECASRGAEVTLITGPVNLTATNKNIKTINVESAEEMFQESMNIFPQMDIAILSAAVADYKPSHSKDKKIKRKESEKITIDLTPNPDIAASLGKIKRSDQLLIGFALETNDEEANAIKKLEKKNFDYIVLNSLQDEGAGFGKDTNKVTIISRKGEKVAFGLKSKKEVAVDIINTVLFSNFHK